MFSDGTFVLPRILLLSNSVNGADTRKDKRVQIDNKEMLQGFSVYSEEALRYIRVVRE